MILILALLATIFVEFLAYFILIRKNPLKLFLYSVLINSITNPLANFAYQIFGNFLIIEILVFLAEGFLIKVLFQTNYQKAFLVSFCANLASALIGLFLFGL